MCRKNFGSQTPYRATTRLQLVHSDVCQLPHRARDGSWYFVTFLDDFSKYSVVYFIRNKSDVYHCFLHFIQTAERETGCKVQNLRTDNGGEYVSSLMKARCRTLGIKHIIGPPHTPQLNGVAERYNQTLLDRLKPALKSSPFHHDFWTDAAAHAVWTTNRAPTQTNTGFLTPFELYTGSQPNFRHVQTFGTPGHYCLPRADRGKLDDNS